MDLFHRQQEPENRELVWIKPFDNRMEEILRLKEKSETCPEQMKKVFLSAWGELASKVKVHQQIANQIIESGLPLRVYYNVVITTDMGSASLDFLILSQQWIIPLVVKNKEHIEWDRYDTRFAKTPDAVDVRVAEDAACLLMDWLADNRAITKKDMQRVVPVLIDEEAETLENMPELEPSILYPEMCAAVRVRPEDLSSWLGQERSIEGALQFPAKKMDKILEVISEVLS